jgi:hypothetical protein
MKNVIPQHRGRVVDSTGDNLLAEFASVVDAVQAAVEIQQVLRAKNSLLPENRRMEFRIGINLGDVIEEGERIFGDGVTFKRLLKLWPDNLLGRAYLTAACSAAGRESEARASASELMRIDPNFTSEGLIKRFSIRNKLLLDQMVADLRKAGLK